MRQRKLIQNAEAARIIELHRSQGLPIGAIDYRPDGVTIYPPPTDPKAMNAYDRQKAKSAA